MQRLLDDPAHIVQRVLDDPTPGFLPFTELRRLEEPDDDEATAPPEPLPVRVVRG